MHMAFDFSLIFRKWGAREYFTCIREMYENIPEHGWPCNVLSNHDLFRSIDRLPWRNHKMEKAKVAAALLLTLRGTPFIYYGEEIGMKNGRLGYKDIRDPLGKRFWPFFSGRDKARTPMQWNPGKNAGFTEGTPWLPVNADAYIRNVEIQEKDPASLLHFYRVLINLRKRHPALLEGRWVPLIAGHNGILAYARISDEERIIVLLNFTGKKTKSFVSEYNFGNVLYSTHRKLHEIFHLQNLWVFPFEVSIFKA
jgi:alpha-glucosidase